MRLIRALWWFAVDSVFFFGCLANMAALYLLRLGHIAVERLRG